MLGNAAAVSALGQVEGELVHLCAGAPHLHVRMHGENKCKEED